MEAIQTKFGHITVHNLDEGFSIQEQIKAYIKQVKAYEAYSFISKTSREQVLEELTRVERELQGVYVDKAKYEALIDELMGSIEPLAAELNKLQEDKADTDVIIAKAQVIQPEVESALQRLESFNTQRDKRKSLAKLREVKSQLAAIIRDYSRKGELIEKYKAALVYAGEHILKRVQEEKGELFKSIEKPIEKYEITVVPKPGLTIEQLEGIFPQAEDNTLELQKLLDSLNITVHIASEEEASSSSQEKATETNAVADTEATREKTIRTGKERVKLEKEEGTKPTKSYSMKVNGRDLNPDNYVLNNPHMAENITKLYQALIQELGHSNFQFQVTGGDRYEKDGKVYSRTNHQLISNAAPKGAHMEENGTRAVDIRIKLADGSDILPLELVDKLAVKYTKLSLDYNALPSIYPDKHYHLQLPNTEEYGGSKTKKSK